MANKIGVGATSDTYVPGYTQTSVSGGLILTNTINTTDFGNAAVQTGLTITDVFIRTAAANAWHDTVEQPGGTTDTVVQIIRDTVRITLRDTLVETQIVRDTLVETQIVRDSVAVHDTIEAIILVDLTTGAEFVVQNVLQTIDMSADLVFLRGLSGDGEFSIYDSTGALVYRGADNPLRITGRGLFIVAQSGKYYKFVR